MKKNILILSICIIVIIFAILLGLSSNNVEDTSDKTKIVTSFYPIYIASLNLLEGIENVELHNLTSKATGCVHDYTLTPQEMMKLSNADAIVINGSGMENFLGNVIQSYSNLKVIDTSNNVQVLEEKHGINPHTFVSIGNYVIQIQNLYTGLVAILPGYTEILKDNKDKYIEKLNNLKEYADLKLKNFKGENVVALHESFEYFAKDFGINVVAVIEEHEGTNASATEVTQIMEKIKQNNVKMIVTEKDSATNMANAIMKETKVKIVEFDPSITGEENINAYVEAYRENIDKLYKALSEGN